MIGWILFGANLVLDLLAVWYIRELLRRFQYLSDTSQNASAAMADYVTHLEKVYELETYYGDTTLSELLVHSRDLKDELEIYKEMFTVIEEDSTLEEGVGVYGEES